MLLWLSDWLMSLSPDTLSFLRVFRSLTFRALMAALTAILVGIALGPYVIRLLACLKIHQTVRSDGPATHLTKKGTPTMGGVLILLAVLFSTLLWADWRNHLVWVVFIVIFGLGWVGWVDDYRKVALANPKGMSSREKLVWQALIAVSISVYLAFAIGEMNASVALTKLWQWITSGFSIEGMALQTHSYIIPFVKTTSYPLGVVGFIVLSVLVIVGSSNAVNLTDGADGLAILPTVLVGSALGVFAYIEGNAIFSKYLLLPFIPGAGDIFIICTAIAGAGLAFLWYNAYPAQVFMGDVGALSLGGALGVIAVIVRQEIVLFVMGGVFVAETLSVMLQVGWFRYTKWRSGTGRRIFRMAPLHHHFEQGGVSETQVVIRFWIITMILCLIGLASLKLR